MSTLVTSNIKHSGSASNNVELDSSGNLKFNSGYGSAAVSYGCRAWVNFNGTLSGTIAPRASGNVSSVTKNGTGDYTVNFTNPLADANYSLVGTCGNTSSPDNNTWSTKIDGAMSTSAARIKTTFSNNVGNADVVDYQVVSVAIFR